MLRTGLISRSGGVLFTPASLSGLQVWLKEDGLSGADGDPISTWTDSSGQGHHFTQATSGFRPIFKTGILNGHHCARFDGTDDRLEGGDLSAVFPSAATLFVVAAINDTEYSVYSTRQLNGYWRYSGDGAGYQEVFRIGRLTAHPATMPTTGNHYFTIRSDASAWQMWKDGVAETAQSASYGGGDGHQVGREAGGGPLNGDVFEVIIYNSALSSGDIASVHGYLTARFGL